jgi:hypothetical protein
MAMLNFQKTNKLLKHSINEQRTEEDINQSQNESIPYDQTESGENATNKKGNGTKRI